MAASTTWHRKSISVRAASSGENSTLSHSAAARLDAGHGPGDDLLLGHLQLEFAMDGAGGQKDVNPRRLGMLQCFPGPVDVGLVTAGQAADHRPANRLGDLPHRFEIAGRGDRKAGFDDVDPQVGQRLGDLQFFVQVHAGAGRLLAVAQRGVEDPNRPSSTHCSRCLAQDHGFVVICNPRTADPRSARAITTATSSDRHAGCPARPKPAVPEP